MSQTRKKFANFWWCDKQFFSLLDLWSQIKLWLADEEWSVLVSFDRVDLLVIACLFLLFIADIRTATASINNSSRMKIIAASKEWDIVVWSVWAEEQCIHPKNVRDRRRKKLAEFSCTLMSLEDVLELHWEKIIVTNERFPRREEFHSWFPVPSLSIARQKPTELVSWRINYSN